MVKYTIFVDTREASSAKNILKGLSNYEDIQVEVRNLGNAVDYAIPTRNGRWHIIQRKTATEMVKKRSVLDDVRSLKLLEEQGHVPYLLLEGSLHWIQKWSRWKPEPIIGLVESILEDWNVKIIPSPIQYWTVKWLALRAKKLGSPKETKLPTLSSSPRGLQPYEYARAVLETFPGISTTLAERILSQYGSLWQALTNLDRWHLDVAGVGPKKCQTVKKVLCCPWPKKLNTTKSN